LTPEKLEGANLYKCENCNEKVEAIKGLRFSQLSRIITIQLNRFELDLESFERKKVNNYVSYPFVLDMNKFLKSFDEIQVEENKELLETISKEKEKEKEKTQSK